MKSKDLESPMSIHKHRQTKSMRTVIGVIVVIRNVIKRRNYRNYGVRNLSLALTNCITSLDTL